MTSVAVEVDLLRGEFERFRATRPLAEPALLSGLRERCLASFQRQGFPTTRDEDWKNTSTAALARIPFQPAAGGGVRASDVESVRFDGVFAGREAVFVNGRLAPEQSSLGGLGGVEILDLTRALQRVPRELEATLAATGNAFHALNGAFFDDIAVVVVPRGTVLAEPVHLLFLAAPGAEPTVSHPRVLVVAGEQSQVSILESYVGGAPGVYWTNSVTEVTLGDGAIVDHVRLQCEAQDAFHTGTTAVVQGRASRFRSVAVSLGAAFSRHDIRQEFAGEGGECELFGLFALDGTQHGDTHVWVDHARPHCTSRQVFKGLLSGSSRGVFAGRILVRADAQKTDAQQSNRNLLLSNDALVDSLPQLEILANDVKCKHGSTTGQIDPLALFYLRSRGIGEEDARALLASAFASDVLGRIPVAAVSASLERQLRERRLTEAKESA